MIDELLKAAAVILSVGIILGGAILGIYWLMYAALAALLT